MKKFLSTVLALAMAMSLMTFATVTAGAKDFTDNSSINYKEAVDVISAIQIMDGYADASFNPSGTLTRGAAAKIICNMILGPTTAQALPTNVAPFPDVPSGHTFAGYIAYCSEHNIISGYADGNFRPGDSLSGYAYLKMLLGALGYDQKVEGYQGANWRVNVAKQALGIGLEDNLIGELDGSRIVTREEAALYAFNTLQADMVEYDNRTDVNLGNGISVTVGGNTNAHTKTDSTQRTQNRHIDTRQTTSGNIIQFAEEYFPNLVRDPVKNVGFAGGQGDFGEPSTTWTWKGVKVGDYNETVAKTYKGDVKVSAIYNDLGLSGTANYARVFLNGDLMFYVDIRRANDEKLGKQKANDDGAFQAVFNANLEPVGKTNLPAAAFTKSDGTLCNGVEKFNDKVGDGTIIQVFYDEDSNSVIISAKSVYPGQITSVNGTSATKDAYVKVEQKQNGNNAVAENGDFNKSGHDEYTTNASFAEDDMVWFTYSNKESKIGEVVKMESVEGQLTRRSAGKNATLDGTTYDFGKEIAYDMPNGDADMTNTSSYVIYTDAGGYALWIEEADFAVERYALVERIWVEMANGATVYHRLSNGLVDTTGVGTDSARVRLLLSNGSTRLYDLDEMKRYRNNAGTNINTNYDAGQVVRFTENSDGTVRLYPVAATGGTTRTADTMNNTAAQGVFTITNHTMSNLFRNDGSGNFTEVRADSDTIFVIKDPDNTKAYTGIRNAPDVVKKGAVTPIAYAFISSGNRPTAKLVFVEVGGNTDVESASKDITFLTNPSDRYTSDSGDDYYEYTAIIKGVKQDYPVRVYTNTLLTGAKENFTENDGNAPSVEVGNDYMTGSIILNRTKYDNDDYLTEGYFSHKTLSSNVAQGIKKTSKTDEIKLDTHDSEFTATVASGVNIFYVDEDNVTTLNISDITNDTEDVIYYTVDDDGDITNLFIVEHEDDDVYMSSAWIDNGNICYTWNTDDATENAEGKFQAKSDEKRAGELVNALRWNSNVANASLDYAPDNNGKLVFLGTITVVSTPTSNVGGTYSVAAAVNVLNPQ